ncbi:MAG: HAMP domain-containing sensor histidine kinase [Anaerolineae bacterium]
MLKATSIRTRLMIVYVGIILLGFAGLALVAGGQISSAAQVDFTQRLQNEITLVAQGLTPTINSYLNGQLDQSQLDGALTEYESQISGSLELVMLNSQPDNQDQPGDHSEPRDSFRDQPELESALHDQRPSVERRDNSDGADTYFTAAPIMADGRARALLQLCVPASSIQSIVVERWLALGSVFGLVTAAALAAAWWLARSIIEPLYKLRDSAVRLAQGNFSHRVSYDHKDEIGEVARAFNEMAQQVESMLEEQRGFASNTSHELRTPLTTIRLRTEALRYDDTLDADTSKQYVAEIDDEVARLSNLIQDLTLLSRFDAGRAELGKDEVDMLRFASSMQQQITAQTKERKIHVTLELPQEPLPVNASLNHLTVVFRNLLDNAIKYSPEGSSIVWNIEKADDGARCTIRDTGRGVDAEHLPHLFERFYRADRARSRDIPGTGLGLALVKSIVEAYGGRVEVDSGGAGTGMTVTVLWPYRPARAPGAD